MPLFSYQVKLINIALVSSGILSVQDTNPNRSGTASVSNPLERSEPLGGPTPSNLEPFLSEYQRKRVPKSPMEIVIHVLSQSMCAEFIGPITNFLESCFIFTAVTITNLRAWIAYTFQSNPHQWPIIEWEEGPHTRVLVLFKVDPGTQQSTLPLD